MKKLIALSLLLALSNIVAGSPNRNREKHSDDTAECLIISGKLKDIERNESADNYYKVELIYYNNVIESVIKKDNKSFKFTLKKNSIYTIRISKKGYIDKLISINTSLTGENQEVYRFHFDTDLFKEDLRRKLDSEALEFPIALVSFNYVEGFFYFNEEYTMNIKKNIFEK